MTVRLQCVRVQEGGLHDFVPPWPFKRERRRLLATGSIDLLISGTMSVLYASSPLRLFSMALLRFDARVGIQKTKLEVSP